MVQQRSTLGLSTFFALRVTNSGRDTVRSFRYLTEYRLDKQPLHPASEEQTEYRGIAARDHERLLITLTGYDEDGSRRIDASRVRVDVWIVFVDLLDRTPWEDNGTRLCRATIQE